MPLAERLRELRQERQISVRTLATSTGFSPSFISQVELGQASPSITSLERIAHALGVTVGAFFDPVETDGPVVVRRGEAQELESAWSLGRLEALGPLGSGRAMEPVMITLGRGGRSGKQAFAHPGEEFAHVITGRVTLTLGDAEHHLRAGDSVSFAAETPHLWENDGDTPAQILLVSTRFSH